LGDNENAIKIQIYCVLIVNLLIGVIKKSLKDNGLSNLVSFFEIHLFNYIHLTKFLVPKRMKLDAENNNQLNDDYLAIE
jgi:hypothetical protein